MPNITQAKKRVRQAEKSRMRNKHHRTFMRTEVKSVINAIEAGDKEAATAAYTKAVPAIDTMVSKGIIHKNKAARTKSRLNAHIRGL